MCTDDAAVRALGFDPSKLASLVPGLPPGTVMGFTVGLNDAPTVTTNKDGTIGLHVTGAELIVSMASPGKDTANITVASDFTVGVQPTVDPNTGMITASLTDLSMERMDMSGDATGADYSIDPERLQVLMHDVVLPMASAKMRNMPLSPSSFGVAGMYAWLDDLYTNSSGIYVGVEPFIPAPAASDTSAPDTTIEKNPGKLVRAGMARYTVGGTDDKTPYQLLRYEWQVDDGAVQPASFSKVINAAVTAPGPHTFRVRSVDLTDKHADQWITHSFELDPIPPTLEITQQPEVTVRAQSAKIVLTGSDDRSKPNLLSFAYRVLARAPGGEQTLVETGEPTGLDGGVGEIVVHDLQEDSVYEVTVLLYDEAGNVTSKKIGFAAASVNGCSVSGADGFPITSSLGSLLLIGAALFFATRRRLSR
jgi:MYXO-CTERM domain-containing protein